MHLDTNMLTIIYISHFISFILHSVNPYKVCNLSDIELVMNRCNMNIYNHNEQ
jgi:hypothetical protein